MPDKSGSFLKLPFFHALNGTKADAYASAFLRPGAGGNPDSRRKAVGINYIEKMEEKMKKTTRKLMSLLLTFVMVLSLLPAAWADAATSQWPSFRGNDSNMGITAAQTPVSADMTKLNWAKSLGSGWSAAPSAQIIVDGSLIVMSGKTINKLRLTDGTVEKKGTMTTSSSFGYTPPAYDAASKQIIVPLGGGTLQAFNAETLASAWIFKDSKTAGEGYENNPNGLGGQALSPITCSEGKIYTGFWNGESNEANYVCVDAKTGKLAWSYAVKGGFYWAGSVSVGSYIAVGTDDGASGASGDSHLLAFKKTYAENEEIKPVSDVTLTGCGDQRSSLALADGRVYFTTKGGYLCSAAVDGSTGAITDLKTVSFGSQSTSTPVVYGDHVYFGTGAGVGSSGNFVIAAKDTLQVENKVGLTAYPQCSMLLSTAYENTDGYLYFYSTYNANPGGITLVKVKANDVKSTESTELYDAKSYEQYCICSIICDGDGNLYYKNDSGNVFSIGKREVPQPEVDDLSEQSVHYVKNAAAKALTITATVSKGTLSYQWQSKAGTGDWTDIQGAADSSYTPATSSAGTTNFRCRVTNTLNGKTEIVYSSEATVLVKDKASSDAAIRYAVDERGYSAGLDASAEICPVSAENTVLDMRGYSSPRLWIAPPEDGSIVSCEVIGSSDMKLAGNSETNGIFAGYLYFDSVEKSYVVKVVSKAEDGTAGTFYLIVSPDGNYQYDSCSVDVTLSDKGTVVVPDKSVSVKDLNHDGKFDVNETLYAAHEAFFKGGAAAGYSTYQSKYGPAVDRLWGVGTIGKTASVGYWLNNQSCMSPNDEVKAGDHLAAFNYADDKNYTDAYACFDSWTYSATTAGAGTLNLKAVTGYDSKTYAPIFGAYAGASLTAYDSSFKALASSAYTVKNNGGGSYSVQFNQAGTYYVVAAADKNAIVPAVCSVTVSEAAKPSTPKNIRVSFRLIGAEKAKQDVDLSKNSYLPSYVTWIPTTAYTLEAGAAVGTLFKTALDNAGISYKGLSSNYISSITAPAACGGYELSEFTNGPYSGWMYTVNGKHPDKGLQDWKLNDNDVVVWHYVSDYRYEVQDWHSDAAHPALGDGSYWSKWLQASDTAPKAGSSSGTGADTGTAGKTAAGGSGLAPKASVSGSTATAAVQEKTVTDAVAAVQKSGEKTITIVPTDTGSAKNVDVSIPKTAVKAVVDGTGAGVEVDTAVGSVTIPNETLAAIVKQAGGDEVKISVEQKTAADIADKTVDAKDAVIAAVTVASGDKAITSFGGQSLTVSIPVDSSYKAGQSYKVIILSANGTKETASGKCVLKNGKLAVEVETVHLSTFIVTRETVAPISFTDVKSGDWYCDAVQYAVGKGIFTGTTATTFEPNTATTRAMLVTVLYRMENKPAATAGSFTDVKAGSWYADAVAWAAANKLVTGYGDSRFGPEDTITREQMAAILMRYADYKKLDVSKTAALTAFTDAGSVSTYAADAMKWAVGTGLISGTTDTTLSPAGSATRAQAAAILMRFNEKLAK